VRVPCSPFDKLRVSGSECAQGHATNAAFGSTYLLMLSLSKHEPVPVGAHLVRAGGSASIR